MVSLGNVSGANLPVEITGNVLSVGKFFSIVGSNNVMLSGSQVSADTARVVVNGDDAIIDSNQKNWTKSQVLLPGINRFFVGALNNDGSLIASTNLVVLSQTSIMAVSGSLAASTIWSNGMGVIHITNTVSVPGGKTLTIEPGTVVLFTAGAGIAVNGGSMVVNGTTEDPVFFGPLDGSKEWGPIGGANAGANVAIRHAESVGGRFSLATGASLLLEDSDLHHFYSGSLLSGSGGTYTLRRLHMHHYHDSNMNSAHVLAEDCLIEDCDSTDGDPFEMSGALNGTLIQRVTLRRSSGSNSDAFDLNSGAGVTYINNLVHDISDKAFSIGTAGGPASQNITVSNNLVWNAHTGIAIKDGSTASVIANTIVDCDFGIQVYPKYSASGGHLTNGYDNILWNNQVTLVITNGSIVLNQSDLGGSVFWNTNAIDFTGTNNIDADPLFVDPVGRDYHLMAGSPVRGTGRDGNDMGVIFPVGGIPGAPANLAAITSVTNAIRLVWEDNADNESTFRIERSLDSTNWDELANVAANVAEFQDSTMFPGQKYYYRIQARNSSGASGFSNFASAVGAGSSDLRIDWIETSKNGLTLQFVAMAGESYEIQIRDALDEGHPWRVFKALAAQPETRVEVTSIVISELGADFYRIVSKVGP